MEVVEYDHIKFRKTIRLVAFLEITFSLVMILVLSFGIFPIKVEGDKTREGLAFGIFMLYSIQLAMAVILVKGTHQPRAEDVFTKFRTWLNSARIQNLAVFAEVYFYMFAVNGDALPLIAFCLVKTTLRVLFMQIVDYSMRDIIISRTEEGLDASSSTRSSSRSSRGQGSRTRSRRTSDLENCLTSPGTHLGQGTWGRGRAPPYEDTMSPSTRVPEEPPPTYEEAIKFMNECKS